MLRTIIIDSAADLNNLAFEADETRVWVSMPVEYLSEDPSLGYTAETDGLWAAIETGMGALGWDWNGSADAEEGGNRECMTFVRA